MSKRGLVASLLFVSTAVPLWAETPYETFVKDVGIIEQRAKSREHKDAYVHIKVRQLIDYETKEYYEKKVPPTGLDNLIRWMPHSTAPYRYDDLYSSYRTASGKPSAHWYDDVDALNKYVQDEYRKQFNICLEFVHVEPWAHDDSSYVAELMQDAKFVRPGDAQLVVGLTGIRPANPLYFVAGQADREGNHMVVMMDKSSGNLTYVHELGHMFKARHVNDRKSIMYPSVRFMQKWDDVSKKTIMDNRKRSWVLKEEEAALYTLTESWKKDDVAGLRHVMRALGRKDHETATAKLTPLIERHVQTGYLYYLQGEIHSSADAAAKAIPAYESALKYGADYAVVQNNLSYFYCEEQKNLERALELAQLAVRKKQTDDYLDTLGWAYYHNGKYADAERELLRAKGLENNDEYQYHLGMTYDKLGKKDKAKKAFWQVVDVNGKFKEHAKKKLAEYK